MNSDRREGVKIGMSIWGIGIGLTTIIQLIHGWQFAPPPLSFMVLLFMLTLALIRLIENFFNILWSKKVEKRKAEMVVHLLGFGFIVIVIFAYS